VRARLCLATNFAIGPVLEKIMFSISVHEGDILHRACDLLVLKHADDFYGVDLRVAELIGFKSTVPQGKVRVVPGRRTEAKRIAFIGVGPLSDFEYRKIRDFGRRAIEIARHESEPVKRICMPIHGPGFGLDEAEAFSSLIAGIMDAAAEKHIPQSLEAVEIVEHNPARVARFRRILGSLAKQPKENSNIRAEVISQGLFYSQLKSFGSESELKTRLFVAMPFKEEFNDEWEISIQEAANSLQILCERIDKTAFVGDISAEIKRRIEEYDGLIALLNGANPNVFLEIGYAWAKNKPTLLLARAGQELPFDVKGQRCIFYTGIADLRSKLKSELQQLQSSGVLRRG
jgi:hypothetical protein